jgi:hypothetical protein
MDVCGVAGGKTSWARLISDEKSGGGGRSVVKMVERIR